MELNLTFTKKVPDHQGQFLIKWKEDSVLKSRYAIISVRYVPPYDAWGTQFHGYLAVPEWNMKSVEKINMDYVEGIAELPL